MATHISRLSSLNFYANQAVHLLLWARFGRDSIARNGSTAIATTTDELRAGPSCATAEQTFGPLAEIRIQVPNSGSSCQTFDLDPRLLSLAMLIRARRLRFGWYHSDALGRR